MKFELNFLFKSTQFMSCIHIIFILYVAHIHLLVILIIKIINFSFRFYYTVASCSWVLDWLASTQVHYCSIASKVGCGHTLNVLFFSSINMGFSLNWTYILVSCRLILLYFCWFVQKNYSMSLQGPVVLLSPFNLKSKRWINWNLRGWFLWCRVFSTKCVQNLKSVWRSSRNQVVLCLMSPQNSSRDLANYVWGLRK